MDEKKLASRLAGGDQSALGEIIDAYSGYVHTVAFNFSRGALTPEDIDEISQDVFCGLWSCRANINADIGLRSYLSAAARNAVKDRFRKSPPGLSDISELEISSDFSVESAAELNEMTACLYEGLKRLSKRDRAIFIRFYAYGEKISQIASDTGTREGAVANRLYRLRKRLKSYLNERGFYNV